jgi:pyrimidine deaminase RibD-like protein
LCTSRLDGRMGAFEEQDRHLLNRACDLVQVARRSPRVLGTRIEPSWAALVATASGQELASATFSPGDPEDAVKKLLRAPGLEGHDKPESLTLYLTLEPKASFDRLPPVTESIRQLGLRRVVVGTLDPARRHRGEGNRTLERMGVEVVVADGEEARHAQQLLEDYGKWLVRGLAVLRARGELFPANGDLALRLAPSKAPAAEPDAVLCLAGKPKPELGNSWAVVLDPDSWERPAERTILYQPQESAVPGARKLSFRNGLPDLGVLLRDLASLGILSVEISAEPLLFRQALGSGLIDSVLATYSELDSSLRVLSRMDRVQLQDGGDPVELRLGGARLVDEQKRFLEARVELC